MTLALFDTPAPVADPVIAAHPVGPVTDTATGAWGLATATFSEDRVYRYRLSRVWDPAQPRVNFVMLNPSTADAFKVDATVRRCIGFAKEWGMGGFEVTNTFALRSRDPKALRTTADPFGPRNEDAVLAAAAAADLVIAAWGVHATFLGAEARMRELLAPFEPRYLHLTKGGHPGHPLYLPTDASPTRWV